MRIAVHSTVVPLAIVKCRQAIFDIHEVSIEGAERFIAEGPDRMKSLVLEPFRRDHQAISARVSVIDPGIRHDQWSNYQDTARRASCNQSD